MRLTIQKPLSINERVLMSRLGYHVHQDYRECSTSYVRRLGSLNFPRFHVYIERTDGGFTVNIHYDEKRPSYAGTPKHAGQYDGDLVRGELERIQTYIHSL